MRGEGTYPPRSYCGGATYGKSKSSQYLFTTTGVPINVCIWVREAMPLVMSSASSTALQSELSARTARLRRTCDKLTGNPWVRLTSNLILSGPVFAELREFLPLRIAGFIWFRLELLRPTQGDEDGVGVLYFGHNRPVIFVILAGRKQRYNARHAKLERRGLLPLRAHQPLSPHARPHQPRSSEEPLAERSGRRR